VGCSRGRFAVENTTKSKGGWGRGGVHDGSESDADLHQVGSAAVGDIERGGQAVVSDGCTGRPWWLC
jgi:hypothetical protein